MTRARRIRTVVASLALALVTAVPVIGAERAPAPQLGDPVVVERTPAASAAGPSGWPYEDGARLETHPSSVGSPRQTGQPTGSASDDDGISDVAEPTPTRSATPERRPSSEAEPVRPVSPLPASSGDTGSPTPTVTPSASSGDDGGDDGGGDDG
ncbi:hypothetical protein [Streptomyces himalayensis]|uniref:Small secreted hydrophilic protein n=1 Tax=Streptomyces himalayensis subsp. himalayensis TaxID=2756131 RepID=A0A7W0I9W0_9ACTN|nr:hypothetical protein [Streptomyces himalayensis]MBA2947673.1 hypothetical protein [Streptomyces himalayensis subsp. himalayensis]